MFIFVIFRRSGQSVPRSRILSTNLGDNADTTAAICGQIAGAYYGKSNIPDHWKKRLMMKNEIRMLADQLLQSIAMTAIT